MLLKCQICGKQLIRDEATIVRQRSYLIFLFESKPLYALCHNCAKKTFWKRLFNNLFSILFLPLLLAFLYSLQYMIMIVIYLSIATIICFTLILKYIKGLYKPKLKGEITRLYKDDNHVIIEGKVKNIGNKNIDNITVNVTWLDSYKNTICDSGWIKIEEILLPNSEKNIKIKTPLNFRIVKARFKVRLGKEIA